MIFLVISMLILLLTLVLLMIRAVRGPTPYDRVLAVGSAGTKTVLILAGIGFLTGRPDFLDIALVYVLINFVATIGVLKFFRLRSFAPSLAAPNPEENDHA